MTIPLQQQIAEVEREIALRTQVYKKRAPKNAEQHMANMEAVLGTLKWLRDANTAAGLVRPEIMIAALVHIRRNLAGAEKGSKGDHFIDVIDKALGGVHLPLLEELARAAAKVLEPLEEKR